MLTSHLIDDSELMLVKSSNLIYANTLIGRVKKRMTDEVKMTFNGGKNGNDELKSRYLAIIVGLFPRVWNVSKNIWLNESCTVTFCKNHFVLTIVIPFNNIFLDRFYYVYHSEMIFTAKYSNKEVHCRLFIGLYEWKI